MRRMLAYKPAALTAFRFAKERLVKRLCSSYFTAEETRLKTHFRGEVVIKSPPSLPRGFNGLCATTI